MTTKQPSLDQVDLVISDLEAWVAFYRALGLDIPDSALWRTPSGVHHVDLRLPNGLTLHFDSPRTRQDLRPRLPRARGPGHAHPAHLPRRDPRRGGPAPPKAHRNGPRQLAAAVRRVLGRALRDRRGPGRTLGGDHEPVRSREARRTSGLVTPDS